MASLSPKIGPLGKRLAAHLLRRTTYHIPPQRIQQFTTKTASEAVDELCDIIPPLVYPDGPINPNTGNPIFNPTTVSTIDGTGLNTFFQELAFNQWKILEMYADSSIRHKMIEFMSSLWIVGELDLDLPAFLYNRSLLLHAMSQGNIKKLASKMTVDNAMLVYLNNNVNTAVSPNENYAREFLELFTILRGETISIGNYTNYTEADIVQAARVLTGFKDTFSNPIFQAEVDPETGLGRGVSNFIEHDTGDKTFSAAFQNQVITGAVDADDMYRELDDFVAMVFNQMETAKAYCRKLYHFFVSDIITTEIETDIITPLATDLFNSDYEIQAVLKKLLKSQHFYDADDDDASNEIIGGKIKSPLELLITAASTMDGLRVATGATAYLFGTTAFNFMPLFEKVEMNLNGPPTVEGFPGYYKAPAYSKNWFNTTTFLYRYNTADYLLRGWWLRASEPIPFKVDPLSFIENNSSNPADGTVLVTEFLECFFPELPTGERFNYFLNALYGDLSPQNWFFAWQNYQNTNDDMEVRIGVERFYTTVFNAPEFQLF